MDRKEEQGRTARPEPAGPESDAFPRTEQEPVPGVEHQPEPDAENIMPAEDQPGTF